MSIPSKFDHELTLYFYPSPGLLWHSPASLALSSGVSKALNRPRALGHVTVRLSSKGSPNIDFHTGMTQQFKAEGKKEVLLKGYGLGILFHDFKGRLESTQELDNEVTRLSLKNDRLSYVRYEITREMAERLNEFLVQYKAKKGDEHYGAPHRPLYGEGGGCSAFAASCLEVIGLMNEDLYKAWTRTHLLPEACIGGPLGKKKVYLWKVLSTFRWAKPDEPHREYFTWDPDKMHEWAKAEVNRKSFKTEQWNEAVGLVIDGTKAKCPTGNFFLGEPDFSRMG